MSVCPPQLRTIWPTRLLAILLVVLLALALTTALVLIADHFDLPAAQAAGTLTITYTCGPYPMQPTSWASSCSVPKFNPALGTLAGVQFTNTVGMSSTIVVENLSISSTATFSSVLTGTLNIYHPTTPGQLVGNGYVLTTASSALATYDGVADFAGPSGRTYAGLSNRTSSFTVTTGLNAWVGATGNVTMPITATSQFNCIVTPAGNSLCGSVAELSGLTTVTYLYNTPDISVTKRHTGNFVVGAPGVYTIGVRNVGLGPTIGPITATDTLPPGLTFVSFYNPEWTLAGQSGQVLTFTRSSVLGNWVSNIVITVSVTNTAIGTVTNTVSVTTTRDLDPANNSTTDRTTVLAGVDLSIGKTESRDPVTATNNISYTLSVSNAGPSTAPSVRVTDTLPSGMTFVNASGSGWSCSPSGGNVICTRASLPIGAAPDIVITATAPANGGVITNTAVVGSTGYDFSAANNTATVTTTVTAISDLSITKSDSPDPVFAGTTLTYTLNVNNAGPSRADNVVVTDTLPAGATFLSASGSGWGCAPSGGDVICTRASLAVGAAPSITLRITTPGNTPLLNTAAVGSDSVDLNPANNSASASTTVNPVANLAIAKSDSPDPVVAGAALTYTLSITNSGPNDTTSVMVTDTLPAGAAFGGVAAPGWNCGQSGGVVTCSLANLAVGAAPDIVINTSAPGATGVFTNTASVSSALPDLSLANNSVSITTTAEGALADLSITKSDDPDPVNIGAPLTYTLHVANAGPNPAATVRVTDTLPSGVTVTSILPPSGWTCGQSGGVVTCTVPSLAVGTAADIVFLGAAPTISGTIANIASIGSTVPDPIPSNNSVSALTTVYSLADLSITKQESADPIPTSATLIYTLSVANAGPNTAAPVQVLDTLPAGAAFVSASGSGWSCAQAGGVVTCTLPSLAVGPAPNIVVTVTTPALAQTITNTATVASPLTDLNPADNTATASTVVSPADLVITKSDGQSNAVPGTVITYTIVVTNSGPGPVAGAVVSDTFPASLSGVTWTCSATGGSSCPASGSGNISATVNLADGGVTTFTATGQVLSGASGVLVNTATVSPPAGGVDPNLGNNTATDTDTLLPLADLVLVHTDSPDPVTVGNFLRYRIIVTNTGPSNATNVVITETLSSVTFDFASGDCTEAGGALVCNVGTLTPGAGKTINVYVIPSAAGDLVNTATATSAEYDPTPSNSVDAETTAVIGFAEVSISKTDNTAAVNVGGPVTYVIVVSNTGPHAVVGATVADVFPSGLTGMTWTCAAAGGSVCPASGSGNINASVTVTVGGTVTFTASGTVSSSASATLANTATVTVPASVTDTNTANNSAADTDTVIGVPVTGGTTLYLPLVSK